MPGKVSIGKITCVTVVAVAQLALTWASLTYIEAVRPTPHDQLWRALSSVLGFPLLYAADWFGSVDVLPLLIVANAILWGWGIVAVVGFIRKRLISKDTGVS